MGTFRAELTCILHQVHSRRYRTCSGPRVSCQRSVEKTPDRIMTLMSWRIMGVGAVSPSPLYSFPKSTNAPIRSSCHRHGSSPRGHEGPRRGGHDHLAARRDQHREHREVQKGRLRADGRTARHFGQQCVRFSLSYLRLHQPIPLWRKISCS